MARQSTATRALPAGKRDYNLPDVDPDNPAPLFWDAGAGCYRRESLPGASDNATGTTDDDSTGQQNQPPG